MSLFDFRKPPPTQSPAPRPDPLAPAPAEAEPVPAVVGVSGVGVVPEGLPGAGDGPVEPLPAVAPDTAAAGGGKPADPAPPAEATGELPSAVAVSATAAGGGGGPVAPGLAPPDRPTLAADTARAALPFVQRIVPKESLKDDELVLPPANTSQFVELQRRVKFRGKVYQELGFAEQLGLGNSVVALFTGARGTGKTLAAEHLALANQLDVLKVDLAAVFSLPNQEREQSLQQIFDEAKQTPAILLFTQAESLFNERYELGVARLVPIAYALWQYVDTFDGTVIFATTVRSNWGEAFAQRLHVIVEFPIPEAGDAFRILKRLFPPDSNMTLPPDAELRKLTDQFRLSGGSFESIVLGAAFRAVERQSLGSPPLPPLTIRQEDLVEAIAREYQKLGKLITSGEFGDFFALVPKDVL